MPFFLFSEQPVTLTGWSNTMDKTVWCHTDQGSLLFVIDVADQILTVVNVL